MRKLIVGIDETATETKQVAGWSYFCIPESDYLNFEDETKKMIKQAPDLKAFHGKKFNTEYEDQYEEFLRLLKRYTINSQPSLLCYTLLESNCKKNLDELTKTILLNVFKQLKIEDKSVIQSCESLIPSLCGLMYQTRHFGSNYELDLYVGSETVTKNFKNLVIKIKNQELSANFILSKLYNALCEYKFNTSPRLVKSGITVKSDNQSCAIQAADIIAHFGTTYTYYRLGSNNKKRIFKGQIFERVFKEEFGKTEFNSLIKIKGENDLELLSDTPLTLHYSSYLE